MKNLCKVLLLVLGILNISFSTVPPYEVLDLISLIIGILAIILYEQLN
jgi:hypothetical protein